MAMEILASLSEDEATRLAYSRRKDDLTNYNTVLQKTEEALRQIEENRLQKEKARRQIEESDRRAEEYRRKIEESDRRTANAVKALRAKNLTTADIAEALGQTEEEIEKLL